MKPPFVSKSTFSDRQRLRSLALFLLLQAVIITSLSLFKNQEEENLLRERRQDLEQQFRASTLTYRRLAEFAFSAWFNQPEVIATLARADQDPGDRAGLREQLNQAMRSVYNDLRRSGFRQVHFHLPHGTSFLRLHLPAIYGDDLRQVRPSVAMMIREQRFLEGYEIGRHWHAYRFLFPLHLGERYVGSVELSLPLSTILNNLMDTFPSRVRFVIRRSLAKRHLDPEFLKRHYQASPFGPDLLEERPDRETAPLLPQAGVPRLTPDQQHRLDQHLAPHLTPLTRSISIDHRIDGMTLLSTLVPIRDISGADAGILIFDEPFPYLNTLRNRYILGWLVVTGCLVLLLVLHDRYARGLRNSHAELDQVFNSAADGIRILDNQGIIVKANKTFARMAGLDMDRIIGRACHTILGGDACTSGHCPRQLIEQGQGLVREEAVKTRPDGSQLTCLVEARPFYDSSGRRIGIIEDFRDISPRKELERQLQEMALIDVLTGLRNRRGFMELAAQHLLGIRRAGNRAYLLFADLDNMKEINDHLGHAAGDRALCRIADLLLATVRKSDIVARMGGDEFAVLMGTNPDMDSEEAILNRLHRELERMNNSLPPEERISISIGVVRAADGIDLEDLLHQADQKMYAVKEVRKKTAAVVT